MTAHAPCILMVEDHAVVRAGLRHVLVQVEGIGQILEADSARAALAVLASTPVDLMLLDLNLPDADGFEVLRQVREMKTAPAVLILSMHAGPVWVQRAMREGAAGYLVKDLAVQELETAVRTVLAGGAFFSASAQKAIAVATRGQTSAPLERLTEREREVLLDVARGLPTKAIALERHISPRTVESHRSSIMRKLELHSVAELTRFALECGLLGPGEGPP